MMRASYLAKTNEVSKFHPNKLLYAKMVKPHRA